MKTFIFLFVFIASYNLFASGKKHVHGAVTLEMSIEKNTMEIEIDSPAESFLGFEHKAKSEKEKNIFNNAENLWVKDLLKIFTPEEKLECSITQSSFKQVLEGDNHSDIEAKAVITCKKNLAGSSLLVSLKKYFPHMEKINIDLVSEQTKSIEIKKALETIKL